METPNLNNPEKNKSPENLEQKIVQEAFELVKNNPNFEYAISINGNLYGQGELNGAVTYSFDQNSQKIVDAYSKRPSLDYGKYNQHPNIIPKQFADRSGGLILFKPYFETLDWERESDKKKMRDFIYRFAFNAQENNRFTTEHRPGTNFSMAMSIVQENKTLDSCTEEKLKRYLLHPFEEESVKFFQNFFTKCNAEFIPDYWKFFLRQKELYQKSKK
jgi:hypothetical protein